MIPLEELFARLESSAEEVHSAAGLVPRPQNIKGLGMRLVLIEMFMQIHASVHLP